MTPTKYPKCLPVELEAFYEYSSDGGHSIVFVLRNEGLLWLEISKKFVKS